MLWLLIALQAVLVSARMNYQLPFRGNSILDAPMTEPFSCHGRPYGYYADVANNCQIYHVCLPVVNGDWELMEFAHFSFLCGRTTVFNQKSLTCSRKQNAIPCADSESWYRESNSGFGVTADQLFR